MNLELYLIGAAAAGVLYLIWRNQRLNRKVNEARAQLEIERRKFEQADRHKELAQKKQAAAITKGTAQDAKEKFIKKYNSKSKSTK